MKSNKFLRHNEKSESRLFFLEMFKLMAFCKRIWLNTFFYFLFAYLGLKRRLSYKGGGRQVEGTVWCFSNFFGHTQVRTTFYLESQSPSQQMNRQYLPLLLVHAPLLSSDPQFEKYWLRRVDKVAVVLDSHFLYASF